MKGKRTYLTVAAGLAYLVGGRLGLWPVDPQLLHAVGLVAAAFLRAAIKGAEQPASINLTVPQTQTPKPN